MKCPKLLFLLAMTACTTLHGTDNPYWIKSDSRAGLNDTSALVRYGAYVRGLDGAARDRELERARALYVQDKSDFHRLQYALALGGAGAGADDRRSAQQLLDPLLSGKHDADLMALAGMLSAQWSEQLSMQAEQSNMSAAQQQCQKRADELQKKLDAVKDIERSLMRREKGKL